MNPTAFLSITAGVARLTGQGLVPGVQYQFDLVRYAGAAPHNFDDIPVVADPTGGGSARWDLDGPVASYVGVISYNDTQLVTATAVGA